MEIGLAYTMFTPENAALRAALLSEGASVAEMNDEREGLCIGSLPSAFQGVGCVLCRSSSLSRSLCLAYLLEKGGVTAMNSHAAQQACGDKVLASAALAKASIPTPKVSVAFSQQSALEAVEKMGYPCVLKPPIGSWGRMVYKITDRHCAEAAIGLKAALGHYADKVYYIQEYIDKPGRDIRALLVGDEIALSVSRSSPSFLTNLSAGGSAAPFSLPPEMEEAAHKVGDLLGSGVYGIDFIEDKRGGFYVLEVNHAPEFSKSAGASIGKVAQKIAAFAIACAKN